MRDVCASQGLKVDVEVCIKHVHFVVNGYSCIGIECMPELVCGQ